MAAGVRADGAHDEQALPAVLYRADATGIVTSGMRTVPARNTPSPRPRPSHPKGGAKGKGAPSSSDAASSNGAAALQAAMTRLGKPYRWGAAGPNAFDCSGLVLWAYQQAGTSVPHSSRTQSRMGTPVSRDQLQPGDLVFFYSPVSHVGIYAGNGKVINATTSGQPVKMSDLSRMPFHSARRL